MLEGTVVDAAWRATATRSSSAPAHDQTVRLGAFETFLSALTRRRLKRGSFPWVVDLQAAIHRYIAAHQADQALHLDQNAGAKLNLLNAPVP